MCVVCVECRCGGVIYYHCLKSKLRLLSPPPCCRGQFWTLIPQYNIVYYIVFRYLYLQNIKINRRKLCVITQSAAEKHVIIIEF